MFNETSRERPVALFDSGVGGLAVLTAVRRLLPREDLVYFADRAWFPYGARADAAIRDRAEAVTRTLLDWNAKLVVVACNTATSAAIEHLRATFDVPFVGVEPGVKPAARASRNRRIAVLATEAMTAGERMSALVERFAAEARVTLIPAPDLTDAIEWGRMDAPSLLQRYLAPVRSDGVDAVVLGCTHYGLLRDQVQATAGPGVCVIDTAEPVARRVAQVLEEQCLAATRSDAGRVTYLTSGDEAEFAEARQRLRALLPDLP